MQCSTDSDVFANSITMMSESLCQTACSRVRRGQTVDVSTSTPMKERISTYAKNAQTAAVA